MSIKNWIIYIVAVISMSLFCVLYIKHSGFVVLMMVVLVPIVFSIMTYFPAKRGLKVKLNQKVLSAKKFDKIEIPIIVDNHSSLNLGSTVVIYMTIRGGVGIGVKKVKRKIRLLSDQEAVVLEFVPQHSGMNELYIEKMKVYNGFSLLCPTIRVDEGTAFLIMPEYQEFAIDPELMYEENEGESDRYSSVKAGNDPSELFDIRCYRPGDRLNRINWNFSAKNDTLMVQDYGFAIACDTAVFVDIFNEKDLDKVERVFEILYFLAVKFTMMKKLFYVIWKNGSGETKRKMISGQEEIQDLFLDLFRSDMAMCEEPIEDLYNAQYEGEFLSGSVFLCAGRRDLEGEIVGAKVRTDYLEFVYV